MVLKATLIIMGWFGSFLIYFALGLMILVIVQSWIKKRNARKGGSGKKAVLAITGPTI